VKKRWLKDWPWQTVVTINAGLCKEKKALHKPTSDGYAPAQKLWESAGQREQTLRETLDICRQCHKLAPFCFYNGNPLLPLAVQSSRTFFSQCPPSRHTPFAVWWDITSLARLVRTNC
jgi:hypothetical protein